MEEKTPDDKSSLFEKINKRAILPIVSAVLVLLSLIIPIPTLALDILIAVNLLFALTIIFSVVCTKKAADFSSLPTLLRLSTIFGLAVNIAAAMLILIKGADFDGRLIRFVSSIFFHSEEITDLIIGSAIFFIIIAINVLVIAKGATRIAEVACRFTLDSMQVKMMTIETEYGSGAINEEEALSRKMAVQKESDFLCTLDGAGKIITGYEKVKIFIIGAIIIGGVLIDTLLNGKSANEAILIYIPLAVGSGILFMIPSFLASTAAGIIVTREAMK